ncbi:DUF1624 domain-containing protein [Methanoculleus sp. FWC-SCC1]|uniref:DUF1624 domain-containing protein n=1 Tax=Methanoculleus frigidifontis TaxID=2584085 RepID=A0ABT8M953_9EURY|nr:heparan-alpha-glucosaminide N-acetyltransferase [Methanoculleus sp. FWC-SCC1]MDN7024453.1 DUF1624 domain-containing protein [Methanoculleus sp. FWC-SCC1]
MTGTAISGRYWEIDAARGIAVVTMILFHAVFDLNYFGIVTVTVATGFWRMLAYATASTFIFLVGLSLTISYARSSRRLDAQALRRKYLKRGATIFGYGLVVTAATYLFLPSGYIVFGILHFIGIAVIIAPFFIRFEEANLLFGVAALFAGYVTNAITGPWPLLWLGIHPSSFTSLDYVPLLPWFGLVLFGIYFGKKFYPEGTRGFSVKIAEPGAARPLAFLGRHSLFIYFLHQPIILAAIFLLSNA